MTKCSLLFSTSNKLDLITINFNQAQLYFYLVILFIAAFFQLRLKPCKGAVTFSECNETTIMPVLD